jgi:3'-5' exoribonuclease
MRRLFLKQAQPGDQIEDVFVITGKQIAATSTGKHYIKCFVGDRTAQVTARMWNATREIFNQFPDNGLMYLRARVENYQGNNQVIIEAWGPPRPGTYATEDLMPTTKKDVGAMFARVSEVLGSLRNRHVRAICQAFLADERMMAAFRRSPAAQSFHHAYVGGLLEHTQNALDVADVVVRFYPKLNRDLVLAGIFLHDLGKTWELTSDTAFAYTDGGQLIGHIVKAAMWVEEKARVAAQALGESIPRALVDVLQHIILSHHGELEFGSPKTPATPEAIAVHMLENLDAKLTMSLAACRDDETAGEGNWTEFMKAFGGRMFKPDLAPPDDAAAETDPVAPPAAESPASPAPSAPAAKAESVAARVEPKAAQPKAMPTLNNPLFQDLGKPK